MMTALYTKTITCTNEENEVYVAFLSHNYSSFFEAYNAWFSQNVKEN
jgi:hypothetical protein